MEAQPSRCSGIVLLLELLTRWNLREAFEEQDGRGISGLKYLEERGLILSRVFQSEETET